MRKADVWSSAVLILLGVATGIESVRLGIGSSMLPGPGFLPLGASLVLVFLALAILVRAWLAAADATAEKLWPPADKLAMVAAVLISLAIYALVWNTLGFSLSTCLLLAFLLRFVGKQQWMTVIAGTLITTVVSYLLFGVFLKVELPAGVIGF